MVQWILKNILKSRGTTIVAKILLLSLFASFAMADEAPSSNSPQNVRPRTGEALAVYFENDTRRIGGPGSDQAYSSGFKVSYIFAEDRTPQWIKDRFPEVEQIEPGTGNPKYNFGLSLGHQIYTPNKTYVKEYIASDRPYAAWLYVGLATSIRKGDGGHFFEVDVGTIGPSALGKQVQNNFHDLIDVKRAEGWKHGLHEEPTLQTFYQRRQQHIDWQNLDFYSFYGGALGNVQIGAHTGLILRTGVNLPDDFGPSRPSASDGDSFVTTNSAYLDRTSYYGFVGVRGNYFLRNIFLDGNTFQDSHHVNKYPFTFETEFGFGLHLKQWSFIWQFVTRSPEFEERSRFNSFASINIKYLFK